jgi:iron complex outermembrane recepter protein
MSQRSTTRRIALALLATSSLAPFGAAYAAETGEVSEVIVTAQRREERLRDVPISITAITSDDIENRGANRLQDLQFAIPGLWSVETSPGSERLQIRGISQQSGLPTVATYLDEMNMNPNAVTGGMVQRSVDLERIEVLKGPQPTLYGEGAMGGTIRYITARPNLDDFQGRAEGQVGTIDGGNTAYRVEGMANLPIAKGVFGLRLAGAYENTGGYIDTPRGKNVNATRYTTFRAKALWAPTDAFEGSLMYTHQEHDQRDADYANDAGVYSYPNSVAQPQKGNYDVANLVLVYDTGPVELLSSTGYLNFVGRSDVFFPFGFPIGGGVILPLASISRSAGEFERWSQELRMTSKSDGPIRYVLGATYTDDSVRSGFASPPYPATVPLTPGQTSKAWAVYGEGSYVSGPVTLTLGARYFSDRRSDAARTKYNRFNTFNPRANVSVKTGDSGIVYANVAKGFRSGGFNTPGKFDPTRNEATYDPEKLWTYELGFKQQIIDNRLSVDGALYYHSYKGIQSILLPIDNSPTIGRTINSGVAKGWGQEIAVVARLTPELRATVTGGHNSLTYRSTSLTVIPGDPLDNVPKWTWSVALDYRRQVSNKLAVFANGELGHTTGFVSTLRLFNTLPIVQRNGQPFPIIVRAHPREVLNARVGADFGNITAYIFGQNLTNDFNSTYAGGVIQATEGARPRPRTLGVGMTAKY